MTDPFYNGIIRKISTRFQSSFDEIAVHYNFDNGDEFEIALCKAIRLILPIRYGICRGFIVTKDNQVAGDDIIIYERDKFPTFRFLDQNKYEQKEDIPIEAVCAYVEAKHSLILNGEEGQSIKKAINQINKVKSLFRKKLEVGTLPLGVNYIGFGPFPDENWPNYSNPIFTAIFARFSRIKTGTENTTDIQNIFDNCKEHLCNAVYNPDLIVFNDSTIALPMISGSAPNPNTYYSPFFIDGRSKLIVANVDKISFGIGVINLLQALNFIILDRINWPELMAQELRMKKSN